MPLECHAKWDGQALWPCSNLEAVQALPRGPVLTLTVRQPRSPEHHGLFFAVLDEAHKQWPETHEVQGSADYLRAWLTCKAGYRETSFFDLADVPADLHERVVEVVSLTVAAILTGGSHAWVTPHKSGIAVHRPKSINWTTLDQPGFKEVCDRVFDAIAAEGGFDVQAIIKEIKAREKRR